MLGSLLTYLFIYFSFLYLCICLFVSGIVQTVAQNLSETYSIPRSSSDLTALLSTHHIDDATTIRTTSLVSSETVEHSTSVSILITPTSTITTITNSSEVSSLYLSTSISPTPASTTLVTFSESVFINETVLLDSSTYVPTRNTTQTLPFTTQTLHQSDQWSTEIRSQLESVSSSLRTEQSKDSVSNRFYSSVHETTSAIAPIRNQSSESSLMTESRQPSHIIDTTQMISISSTSLGSIESSRSVFTDTSVNMNYTDNTRYSVFDTASVVTRPPGTYVKSISVLTSSFSASSSVSSTLSAILTSQMSVGSGSSFGNYTELVATGLSQTISVVKEPVSSSIRQSFEIMPTSTVQTDRISETFLQSFLSSNVVDTQILSSGVVGTQLIPSFTLNFTGSYSSYPPTTVSSIFNESFVSTSSTGLQELSSSLQELSSSTEIANAPMKPVSSTEHTSTSNNTFPSSNLISSTTTPVTSVIFTPTPLLVTIGDTIASSVLLKPFRNSTATHSRTTTSVITDSQFKQINSTRLPSAYYSTAVSLSTILPSRVSSVVLSSSAVPSNEITHDLKFIFELEGDCDRLILNAKLQIEFWQALIAVLSVETSVPIPKGQVEPVDLDCEPFEIVLILRKLKIEDYLTIVNGNISMSTFGVPILDEMSVIEYEVKTLKVIHLSVDEGYKPGQSSKPKLENVDIIIMIIAGVLFGCLLCMCLAIVCRECYKRKRAASFNLLDVPHVSLNMEDFTLTKIPRPQTIYRDHNGVEAPTAVSERSRYKRPESLTTHNINSSFTNGAHNIISADTIQVRIQPHPDGVVVGLTCTPPRSPTRETPSNQSSPRSETSDPSKQTLLKDKRPEFGTTNPNFEVDDELIDPEGNTCVIKEDETEEFL